MTSYFGDTPLISNYLHDIENKTYDIFFISRHNLNLNPKPPKNIVIVGIDATSINKVGIPWPWPRQFHASLLDALVKSGSKLVIFDIIFDTISPLSLQTQDISGQETIAKSTFDAGKEDDDIFAKSLSKAMNVLLACEAEPISKNEYYPSLPITTFVRALNNDVSFLGNTSISYDRDNFVRRAKLIYPAFQNDPAVISSIAFRAAQRYLNIRGKVLADDFIQLDSKKIPQEFLINFYGPSETIKTIPFWKTLESIYKGEMAEFKDKIVLIGRTKLKASIDPYKSVRSPDSFATPFASLTPNYSGVEIQATILGNLLDNSYIVKTNKAIIGILILITGLITILIVWKFRPRIITCLYICTLFSAFYILTAFVIFLVFNILIPPTFPTYGIILPIYLINSLDQYFIVDFARRRQAKIFRQLVPAQVADEIEEMDLEQLALGGTKREITVLFTDIQNFTGLCEKYPPETIINILNKFFTEMVNTIHTHSGLVDKFIGDAIMAIWGAPKVIDKEAQADLAAQSALSMLNELRQLNIIWQRSGLMEEIGVRIGINTSEAITGNVGSLDRIQFSAIGDGVNLAARLEAVNKVYGTSILVSGTTAKLLENKYRLREIDTVIVPGKDTPTDIYELIADENYNPELIQKYTIALNNYRNKNFSEAIKLWQECIKINPNDNPSQIMMQRTTKLLKSEIPNDWKPTWIVENK